MLEKEIEEVTKALNRQEAALRRARPIMFVFSGFGHIVAGVATYTAVIKGSLWVFPLTIVWAWLIIQTIRLYRTKI